MRWLWVDRFTDFVSGSHATGIKYVSLVEEAVDEYCCGYPMLPPTLIIEGMAQMGGIMVAEYFGFEKRTVLAKVNNATFHHEARTGETLSYHVKLDAVTPHGGTVRCTSHRDEVLQAEVDLMFAFLQDDPRFPTGSLFEPLDLQRMMRMMYFFHVAKDAQGNRVYAYENL